MKELNRKGFTLIELLAVITILGILMLVAIPAISRTIENSRRDTFMDTAKSYINAVKTSVAADEVKCGTEILSAKGDGFYYILFNSNDTSGTDLMEQGGKSSWGNAQIKGVVMVQKTVDNNRNKYIYSVMMVDSVGRGIGEANGNGVPTKLIGEEVLSRGDVKTKEGDNRKSFFGIDTKKAPVAPTGDTKVHDGKAATDTTVSSPVECSIVM